MTPEEARKIQDARLSAVYDWRPDDMLATIAAQTWKYGAQCDSCNRLRWRVRREDAENLVASMSRTYPECSYRLVRRLVGPVEVVE